MSMYQHADGLFFGRLPNGDVRILKLSPTNLLAAQGFPTVDGIYPNAILDVIINDGLWGSLVCAVSGGESGGRWQKAMDFHHGR